MEVEVGVGVQVQVELEVGVEVEHLITGSSVVVTVWKILSILCSGRSFFTFTLRGEAVRR